MITALASITKDLALLALDGFSLRHQAIASNIANRDTPEYQRMTVSFEDHLSAISQARDTGATDEQLRSMVEQAKSDLQMTNSGEYGVQLDAEMGDLNQNTLQYQALLTALGRLGSITRSAVSGGQS